jgi:hypothetical protein
VSLPDNIAAHWRLYGLIAIGIAALIFWAAQMSTASFAWNFLRDRNPWWIAVLLFILALLLLNILNIPIMPLPR